MNSGTIFVADNVTYVHISNDPVHNQILQSCSHIQYVPHNDASANDGPHIQQWSHKIMIL
jgi:hypothetical protein